METTATHALPPSQRARLFQNGGSQAVRLPKEFRFEGDEVSIRREGTRVIIEPLERAFSERFVAAFRGAPDETMPARALPRGADKRAALR